MTVNITFNQNNIKRIKEACYRGSCDECPFNRDHYTGEAGCILFDYEYRIPYEWPEDDEKEDDLFYDI